jgi:anti-sigma factor ChrR (cupin superfamily)
MTEMEAKHGTSELAELLTCYAFDLLDPDEAEQVHQHLTGCADCAAEVTSLRETAADLPYSLPDLNPHPRVRERVLAGLNGRHKAALEQPLPGVFVKRLSQQKWRKTPYEGVEYKVLYVDSETKNVTSLLKLQPGAAYPAHRHAGVEQCLVLEGSVRIGQIFLEPGDFEYAQAGTDHAIVQSDSGCVLMLISNQNDEVFV